jgi:hypothetical protein
MVICAPLATELLPVNVTLDVTLMFDAALAAHKQTNVTLL